MQRAKVVQQHAKGKVVQQHAKGKLVQHAEGKRAQGLLAAPWAMAARAMSSTSSSGRGKCSRLGVCHLEKRKAARIAM